MANATKSTTFPWLSRVILLDPARVGAGLARVRASGVVRDVPNVWQIALGVLRMWHRVLFRSETIGTCREHPVRSSWRARALSFRAVRFPFLLHERAVAPLDFSGLMSGEDRIVRHLFGAHHDGVQFLYDLELLSTFEGGVDRLVRAARAFEGGDARRREWLRDLVVYDHYHESLLAAVEAFAAGRFEAPDDARGDPDLSFAGYLAWCARQPATPEETLAALREGRYTVAGGVREPDERGGAHRPAEAT
jgi:hypothetical protein